MEKRILAALCNDTPYSEESPPATIAIVLFIFIVTFILLSILTANYQIHYKTIINPYRLGAVLPPLGRYATSPKALSYQREAVLKNPFADR